jgi:hypothetical protein
MEIKSKKELLKIALDNFDKKFDANEGLCMYFRYLAKNNLIGLRDVEILRDLVYFNVKLKNYMFNNIIYDKRRLADDEFGYFWELNKEGAIKRKNYLQYLYEKA